MEFEVALSNVLVTLLYILPGYLICKGKRAVADHLPTLSGLLIYACSPCMLINSLLNMEFSPKGLAHMGLFLLASLLLQTAFMLILFGLFRKKQDVKYRIFAIASVMGNVGFFGLPIVKVLLPDNPEVMAYSAAYAVSMNILLFTVGVYCLTGRRETMSLRAAVLNPTVISFSIGVLLYVVGAGKVLPGLLTGCVKLLGDMSTPLCMIILGVRLATVPVKRLFSRPFVYGIAASKLILYPLFVFAVTLLLPLPYSFRASLVVLSATPCAAVIQSISEIYKSEMELSANCVMLSTLFCFLTVPLATLLL
ncbi:MAG: AEC family transporter [Clostridia bacterium]|nr:AEC family transporter [Clostridia bacterium]